MSGSSKKNKSKFNALFRSVRVGDTSALSNNNSSKKRTDNEHNDLILSEEKDIEKSNETGLENVNGTQTEHKRNTKLGFNSENKQTIKNRNGTQTEYKLNKEKVIKSNSKDKTEHKRNTKLGFISENKQTLKNKNGTQTEHKRNTADALKGGTAEKLESQPKKFNGGFIADETPSIDLLSSIQQSVLMVMYDSAKENNMDFTTGKLTINGIANKAGVNSRSIKTTIARLKDKYYISISSRKDGRGGWVSYRLQRGVFFEIKNSLLSESPEENNHTVPKHEIDGTVAKNLDLSRV
ncbi:hypothetical protein AVI51_15740 (plasmid) [Piscirickettsia salmonis]|uniref:hypothetical protein n=1 Tax=Piscirickettsia salmonis TaxID=1238 RepID=UPI00050E7526|nr:hypothetical protein [Piscirickettsia salmonis]APS52410.1 hypothetical protein AVI50_16305 [Piscirickettsia salmonis]APS55561.1 hypothetical protein AVI51_15740 [Piscirickettsia salmonis]QHS34271.1 hypothetical protein GW535_17285 [Piscirickettsia salmonis]QIX57431.1 hypothetical protein GW536_18785 [Piscirickettsia salmonis]